MVDIVRIIIIFIDEFKRLFKVVDCKRIGKKGMKSMMNEENLQSYMKKYALYSVELN